MEKGCGSGSAPFSSTISIISISIISIGGGVTRQSFGLYFPILFMDLAGKSGKWGLDKICDGGLRRRRHAKSTFVTIGPENLWLMFKEEAWGLGGICQKF